MARGQQHQQRVEDPSRGDPEHVEIRRRALLNGFLGAAAAAMAIAYLSRATGSADGPMANWVDWLLCASMTSIGVIQFIALMDAKLPLVIADDEGIRLRLGAEWVGLPWLAVSQVVTEQRDLPWHEGRLVIVPRNPAHVIDELDSAAHREIRWQRRLHGAPLSIPLSLFTRSTSHQLVHDLKTLAAGRAEVVGLRGRERARLGAPEAEGHPRRRPAGAHGEDSAPEAGSATAAGEGAMAAEPWGDPGPDLIPLQRSAPVTPAFDPVAAVRAARSVMRADVVRDERPRIVPGDAAPSMLPTPMSDEDAPAVEMTGHAVSDPVIGPEITAARSRAGLTVDQLSERTRIRPHVLEGIEADDFTACGGDFYARGHLSTLARYLGLDAAELIGSYDAHYASGPINARQVFEAELATGLGGGLRATSGGPRWSLLIGAALSLTMIWGVARYFTEEPAQIANQTISDSAGLSANREPITSPLTTTAKVSIKAVEVPVRVSITDRAGEQLFRGRVEPGEKVSVVGVGPFEVSASNAGHARVWLDGAALGPVGQGTERGQRRIG